MSPDEKESVLRKGIAVSKKKTLEKAAESRLAPKMPEIAEKTVSPVERTDPPPPTSNPFPNYLTLGGVPLGHYREPIRKYRR